MGARAGPQGRFGSQTREVLKTEEGAGARVGELVPTPHRSLLSILRAEASQEKTGEGALPPEIRQSIVTLSETREFFQEVATTKNNNNNAPPPAVGILELKKKKKKQLLPLSGRGKNKVRRCGDLI